MAFFSFTITPTTAVISITAAQPGIRRIRQCTITVRDMGTATYVSLGGGQSQERRLKNEGDNMQISPAPKFDSINLNEIFIVSDTADSVIEVFGESI